MADLDRTSVVELLARGGSVVLSGLNLDNIDLRGLDLRRVDFSRSSLLGADLRGALISVGTRFKGSSLIGADFRDAVFYLSDKPGAKPSTTPPASLKRFLLASVAKIDKTTTFQKRFERTNFDRLMAEGRDATAQKQKEVDNLRAKLSGRKPVRDSSGNIVGRVDVAQLQYGTAEREAAEKRLRELDKGRAYLGAA